MITMNNQPNAIYFNADGTTDLVVLDDTDGVLGVAQSDLTEDESDEVFKGFTPWRVVGPSIEVGDGDAFLRLVQR